MKYIVGKNERKDGSEPGAKKAKERKTETAHTNPPKLYVQS
jgi:hypothetical protein